MVNNINDKEKEYRYKKIVKELKTYAKSSHDTTKVGAYIVDPQYRDILGRGVNGFANNIEKTEERSHDSVKLNYTVHAEMNALIDVNRRHNELQGKHVIVVGKCVCTSCALMLIQAGITKLHCPPPDSNSKWIESNKHALSLLEEAGVEVVINKDLIGIEEGLTCESKYKE